MTHHRFCERRVVANGLSHHVLEWQPAEAKAGTVVLCHGYLDMAWSWKWVAEELSARGYAVVAFDWRGHGETDWVGRGGYYHFPDYVLDLTELLPQLSESPPHLVGHSMGGPACALLAGTKGAHLRSLTLVEGLGPPSSDPSVTPDRYRAFLDDVARIRSRTEKPMASREEALQRMRVRNPQLNGSQGTFLAEKATRPVSGGFVFRFDPLHRTTSPTPFNLLTFRAFLEAIDVPTLLLFGDQGYRLADEETRVGYLRTERAGGAVKTLHGGHMLHWSAPLELADCLTQFFGGLELA